MAAGNGSWSTWLQRRAGQRGRHATLSAAVVGGAFVVVLPSVMAAPAWPVIRVQDDAGQRVTLARPARRIVSLAPHITELLFAAGAGPYVVGVSEYSDFPAAARQIPRIGGASGLDLERIAALRPDLIVAWQSGNPAWSLQRLEEFGIPIYLSEPRRIEDVAGNLERLGRLAGSFEVARTASMVFRQHHGHLRVRYSQRRPVRVFYQLWDRPLMTVNGAHLISDVIRLCGGINVFADLPALTPKVDIEAVIRAGPRAIIAAGSEHSGALDPWRKWPHLEAVRNNALFLIPHELIARHTPRVLEGAERLCIALDKTRRSP